MILKKVFVKKKPKNPTKKHFLYTVLRKPVGGQRVDFMFIVVFLMLNQC